jgi:hypothetical protein
MTDAPASLKRDAPEAALQRNPKRYALTIATDEDPAFGGTAGEELTAAIAEVLPSLLGETEPTPEDSHPPFGKGENSVTPTPPPHTTTYTQQQSINQSPMNQSKSNESIKVSLWYGGGRVGGGDALGRCRMHHPGKHSRQRSRQRSMQSSIWSLDVRQRSRRQPRQM